MHRFHILLFLLLACFATAIMAQAPGPVTVSKPKPDLKGLSVLVGHWTYEGEYVRAPGSPGGKVFGAEDNQPVLQGFFVEQHQMEKGLLSERHAINFFWYDPEGNTFNTSGFMDYGPTYSAVITMSEHTWTWKGTHVYAGMKTPFRITQIFAADWMSYTLKFETAYYDDTWTTIFEGKWTKGNPDQKK